MLRSALAALLLLTCACSGDDAPAEPDAAPPSPALRLHYVAHASFRIVGHDGTTLLVDPYASRVWLGYDFPTSRLETDAVVTTHPHFDHDLGEFIGEDVPWTDEERFKSPLDTGSFGPFALTGIPGKHADPYGTEFGQMNTLWRIEHQGLVLLHWGDNGPITDEIVGAAGSIDVLFLPIDGEEHILANTDVADAIERLNPSVVVPMHYRHPDLEVSASSPEDLGPIDPWLEGRSDVTRLGTHELELNREGLPASREVWVFDHDPTVVPPS